MNSVLNGFAILVLGLSVGACSGGSTSPAGGGAGAAEAPGAVGALDEKQFSLNECPVLAGEYTNDRGRKIYTERRTEKEYAFTTGEGATEMIVDGKPHAIGDANAKYRVYCRSGVLILDVNAPDFKAQSRTYFTDPTTLIEESTENETSEKTIWKKK